ncbi:MAG: RNA polymerase sigma factor RpoD, partial [uncultured Thermoleophilia bacterium]
GTAQSGRGRCPGTPRRGVDRVRRGPHAARTRTQRRLPEPGRDRRGPEPAEPRRGPDGRDLRGARGGSDRDRRRAARRGRRGRARPLDARDLDGRAPALPQGHRQGAAAHGGHGGRPREADRARRRARQAAHGRGQPPARRLDREELPQPGAAVPRPDPGGHHRPRPGGREVRLPARLQVLHLRHLVDPPGRGPGARGQGPDDPHAGARGREAQQDRPRRAQAARPARPRADGRGARQGDGHPRGRDRADPALGPGADLAREAGRGRGGVRVRPLPGRRTGRSAGGGDRDHAAQGGAAADPRHALLPRAPRARAPLRPRRRGAPHPRRGRSRLQRHARAHPPDREPEPQEAAGPGHGATAPRRRL